MASTSFILNIVLLIIAIIALILGAAATSGDAWLVMQFSAMKVEGGLWRTCMEASGKNSCTKIELVEDWLKACRAFCILACLAIPATALFALIKLLKTTASACIVGIGFLCSALFMLIGVAIFHGKVKVPDGDDHSFGWSIMLGWLSFILCTIGFILSIILNTLDKKNNIATV